MNTFKDYLKFLTESFEPKQINYGTDLTNRKWKELDNDFYVTYFQSDLSNEIFVVVYRNGHVGFGVTFKPNKQPNLNNINTYQTLENEFKFSPRATTSASRIFNNVIYVIIEAIKHFDSEYIYFNGSNADLVRLYDKMINTKSIMKILEDIGYEYKGLNTPKGMYTPIHTFKRK